MANKPYYPVGHIKQKGKSMYVKKFRIAYDQRTGRPAGYLSRRGKTLTHWVRIKDHEKNLIVE